MDKIITMTKWFLFFILSGSIDQMVELTIFYQFDQKGQSDKFDKHDQKATDTVKHRCNQGQSDKLDQYSSISFGHVNLITKLHIYFHPWDLENSTNIIKSRNQIHYKTWN